MRKCAIIAIIWIFLLQVYIIYLIQVANIKIDRKSAYNSMQIENMWANIIEELNNIEIEVEYNEIN